MVQHQLRSPRLQRRGSCPPSPPRDTSESQGGYPKDQFPGLCHDRGPNEFGLHRILDPNVKELLGHLTFRIVELAETIRRQELDFKLALDAVLSRIDALEATEATSNPNDVRMLAERLCTLELLCFRQDATQSFGISGGVPQRQAQDQRSLKAMLRVADELCDESAARLQVVKKAAKPLSLEAEAILTKEGATAPHSIVANRVQEIDAAFSLGVQNTRSCPRLGGLVDVNKSPAVSPRITLPSKVDSPSSANPEMVPRRFLWRLGQSEDSSREGSPIHGSTVQAQLSAGLRPPTQINVRATHHSLSPCPQGHIVYTPRERSRLHVQPLQLDQHPGRPLHRDLSAASKPMSPMSARALKQGSPAGQNYRHTLPSCTHQTYRTEPNMFMGV